MTAFEEDPFSDNFSSEFSLDEAIANLSGATGQPEEDIRQFITDGEEALQQEIERQERIDSRVDEALRDEEYMKKAISLYLIVMAKEGKIRSMIINGELTPSQAAEMTAIVTANAYAKHYGAYRGVGQVLHRMFTPPEFQTEQ